MKRLTNFLLPVEIGMNLDDIASIKFKFQQYGKALMFDYPSERAVRKVGTNVVLLRWSMDDTLYFEPGRNIEMDTFIKVDGAYENPCTEIATVIMDRTLFTQEEVETK